MYGNANQPTNRPSPQLSYRIGTTVRIDGGPYARHDIELAGGLYADGPDIRKYFCSVETSSGRCELARRGRCVGGNEQCRRTFGERGLLTPEPTDHTVGMKKG